MKAVHLMSEEPIPDTAHSEELRYDAKFIARWTDRCIEQKAKYGQQWTNQWAKEFFSPAVIRLINKEIERRKGNV